MVLHLFVCFLAFSKKPVLTTIVFLYMFVLLFQTMLLDDLLYLVEYQIHLTFPFVPSLLS